jgi:hypothetical protein
MEKIDLNKAGLIIRAVKEGKRPSELLKTDENREFLFWYTTYCFIQNKEYKILTEVQASEKLKLFPKMEVFYCKFPDTTTPMPSILKGRKGLQTTEINSHELESEFILQTTGCLVKESDLRKINKVVMKDNRPLTDRVREFNKARIVALVECEQIKDAKKRAECLNNKCNN